jgi:hypothetical protein
MNTYAPDPSGRHPKSGSGKASRRRRCFPPGSELRRRTRQVLGPTQMASRVAPLLRAPKSVFGPASFRRCQRKYGSLSSLCALHLRPASERKLRIGILAVIGLHVALLAPPFPIRPGIADARAFVLTMWQVTASLVGLALVIFVLVFETVRSRTSGSYIWRTFGQTSNFYAIAAFLLASVLAIRPDALLILPGDTLYLPAPPGLENSTFVSLLLLAASLWLVLVLYAQVFAYLDPTYVGRLASASVASALEDLLNTHILSAVLTRAVRDVCREFGIELAPGASRRPGLQAVTSRTPGMVIDVNLVALRDLGLSLTTRSSFKAVLSVVPGQELTNSNRAIVLLDPDSVTANAADIIQRIPITGLQVHPARENLDEALDFITERGIEGLRTATLCVYIW